MSLIGKYTPLSMEKYLRGEILFGNVALYVESGVGSNVFLHGT